MVNDVEKPCPSCSQLYHVPLTTCKVKQNLPLFLPCGHTMCETCIVQIMRCMEPMECKVCHQEAEVKTTDRDALNRNKSTLYQKFPANVPMVGELVMHQIKTRDTTDKKTEEDSFIDLKALLENLAQGNCVECNATTSRMCKQCVAILCDTCFNKTHKSYMIFKNHLLQNIEFCILPTTCMAHTGRPLEYYCNDCKKSVCKDCMLLGGPKSCKNHDVNKTFLEDVTNIAPQVDETFRRLTQTAVDIGHLLQNYDSENGSVKELSKTIATVEQHFSKLFSVVQKNKDEIMNIISNLKFSNRNSLQEAKSEVENSIKKAKKILRMVTAVTDTNKIKQMNLPALLEEAKAVTNTAWYLNKTERNLESLKVTVNEDLVALISDYVRLAGNMNCMYKLYATSELGNDVEVPPAPIAPVYPPAMPKAVREYDVSAKKPKEEKVYKNKARVLFKEVPTYHQKSASVSSQYSDSTKKSSDYQQPVPVQNDQPQSTVQNYQQQVVIQPVTPNQHRQQLREGSQELIYITHIVDPHNFFVQQAGAQELVKDMIEKYRNASAFPTPHPEEIAPGLDCLAFNHGDNMWQRCRVLSVNGKGYKKKSQVFCYDFGCIEFVGVNWLRVLPPSASLIYPLAIYCSLYNCVPKTGQWTTKDSQLMRKIIENKQAKMHIHRVIHTSNVDFKLECDIYTFEHGISLAHALVFHGRANLTNLRIKHFKNMGLKEKFQVYIGHQYYKVKKAELVYITHVVSAGEFYVRKESHQDLYEKLTQELEQEYSLDDKAGIVYLPEIGTVCAVNLENCSGAPDVTWARGVVAEHARRSRVLVQLPDSGHVVQVHWTKLRYISCEKFIRLSAFATKCHLAGLAPHRNKWSKASIEYLQQYMGRVLALQVEDNRKKYRSQGSLGITLYDRAEHVHICVNNEMAKNNFAVWVGIDKSFKEPHKPLKEIVALYLGLVYEPKQAPPKLKAAIKKEDVAEKISDEDLQAKNKGLQGTEDKVLCVRDETQTTSEDKTDDGDTVSLIEPTPMAPLETIKSNDSVNANSASSFLESEDNNPLPGEGAESSNVMNIADWEPAQQLDWEFTAIPRHIDNDGVIYLQCESEQDKLDLICSALDVRFKDTDTKAIFNKWSVGEPCVALYASDSRYYRARVIEVDEDNSTCLVHYIDYGYEENCSFANMRKSVPFHEIPTQAHKCVLNRIRPLGKQWDGQILNYIHKSVVGKQCYVKVLDELVTGAVPIEIEFDKISFNDHLVEVKMAVYIDGSEALGRNTHQP